MALAGLLLLLGAIAWLSEAPLVGAAVAQETSLNAAQRRLLTERLKDRLKALKHDVETGRTLVRAEFEKWTGDERSKVMQDLFDGKIPVQPLPDGADNIYVVAIKDYVSTKTEGRDEEWNPWPRDEEASIKAQRDYVGCVLDRIDYVFDTWWWKRAEKVIELVKQDTLTTVALRDRIRPALSFYGGVGEYLKRIELSDEEKQNPNLDKRKTCPTRPDQEAPAGETALNTRPLSVAWKANCLEEKERRDGKDKPYHPTTAALMYNDGRTGLTTYCSGTLIAPNAVLTAAHCVCDTGAKDRSGQFYRTAGACVNGSYGRLGRSVSTLDPNHQRVFLQHAGHFEISRVVVHPQFRWTGQLPSSDLAILFLKTPVPAITPMQLNTLRRLPPNRTAVAVGYGAHNPIDSSGRVTDVTTVRESAGLKLHADIETGFCSPYERSRKLICWRYKTSDRLGIRLGSTCRGDSGGPLYADSGGQTYLVGVTSGGGPSCQPDTRAYDVEVYAHKDWIQRQLMMNPPPRGSGSSAAASPGRDSARQIACHFCSLCDQLRSPPIKMQGNARRLRISVNCTPDDITRHSELKLRVSKTRDGADECRTTNPVGTDTKDPTGTAVSCALEDVTPNQTLYIELKSGLLQQCQVVATAFDRVN